MEQSREERELAMKKICFRCHTLFESASADSANELCPSCRNAIAGVRTVETAIEAPSPGWIAFFTVLGVIIFAFISFFLLLVFGLVLFPVFKWFWIIFSVLFLFWILCLPPKTRKAFLLASFFMIVLPVSILALLRVLVWLYVN